MVKRILIRPKAIVDLDEQFAYIAENNFDAALIFFDAAQQTFAQLAELPNIGSIYNSRNSRLVGLRKWAVKGFNKHLIFYLDRNECIEIVRLIHSARDISEVLEQED
jgi:toxin ParE1/3/4